MNIKLPEKMLKIYQLLDEEVPVGFRFNHEQFILEIQYELDFNDQKNYVSNNQYLKFAVNSDGYELLVDLQSVELDILQKENEDVDYLELTVGDLLEAKRYSLNKNE